MIVDTLAQQVSEALRAVVGAEETLPEPAFERPRKREHGDWATNVALHVARGRGNPRSIAEALVAALPESDLVERVEVAGPGFLNFHLAAAWLHDVVRRASGTGGDPFGRTATGEGSRVNVEYVSANPTGPVNVVSGRHAAIGDVIANLLEATGHEVSREFYVNDAGRQMKLFGLSLDARYRQLHGHAAELPEDGYQGDYVSELARDIAEEQGDKLLTLPDDERAGVLRELGLARMLASMKASLRRFGTVHDTWFQESALHDTGTVRRAIELLREAGHAEERDGALWFLSTRFGDDQDRVIIRANGEPTYFAADLGYLQDKFGRGFDRLIYLWGADHHGTVPRFMGAVEALGYDRSSVEVELIQIVNLKEGGEAVKGSKRAGRIVMLDDLVEEVGVDAARYMFLQRALETHVDFDIEAVKSAARRFRESLESGERDASPESRVFYVQYAHARICSILRKASEQGHEPDVASAPLERLEHPREDQLMRKLASYEEVVPDAARLRAPQRIPRYVEELAATFNGFYRDCRVVSDDETLTRARLALCVATRSVIADALGLLGVSAPERM